MLLAEEFEVDNRRIDLLCMDRNAKLVVVELKREDSGHMELQALRYAAMVSRMTFDRAVAAHQSYLQGNNKGEDARQRILDHLDWDEPKEGALASDVSIVLVATRFSDQIMTTVTWLGEHDLDIRCIKLMPYKLDEKPDDDLLLDIVEIYPWPEAADHLIRLEEHDLQQRQQRRNRTFCLRIGNQVHPDLPQNRLALLVIREAVKRGTSPKIVCPGRQYWLIVPGDLSEAEFLEIPLTERDGGSSRAESKHFFTSEDDLIKPGDKTYALKSTWGPKTLETVNRIINQFNLSDVTYKPMN